MIAAPSRSIDITNDGKPSQRFSGWLEQASRDINQGNHPGFSQIMEPSRGAATLTYTQGFLTQVSYADASTKDFTYTDGVLTSIVDSSGPNLTFVFTNGVLSGIT